MHAVLGKFSLFSCPKPHASIFKIIEMFLKGKKKASQLQPRLQPIREEISALDFVESPILFK